MIEVRHIVKRFGHVVAVDDLSFDVHPGRVTGFLGPNGSGKSTTMRCMLGLDVAQSGDTSFDGRPYRAFERPLHEVGALLDAGYVHPGRSGRNHLRWLAMSNGIATSRVDDVLELVGLTEAGTRRVKGYSLGMRQRLGLASVLLGDPHTIILDEPANGLDPEGIRWIRDVLKDLAADGRAVLVSSHLLSEMALMATELVVIGRGRLVQQGTVDEFAAAHSDAWVRVRTPQLATLVDAVQSEGAVAAPMDPAAPFAGAIVRNMSVERVGEIAHQQGVVLHELAAERSSLEDAFLRATADSQEYRTSPVASHQAPPMPSGAPPPPPPPPGAAPVASPSGPMIGGTR